MLDLSANPVTVRSVVAALLHKVLASRISSWIRKSRRRADRATLGKQDACLRDMAVEPVEFLGDIGTAGEQGNFLGQPLLVQLRGLQQGMQCLAQTRLLCTGLCRGLGPSLERQPLDVPGLLIEISCQPQAFHAAAEEQVVNR